MENTSELEKQLTNTLAPTNLQSLHKISGIQDNLAIFFNNIVLYCKLCSRQLISQQQNREIVELLRQQLNELWFDQKFIHIRDNYAYEDEQVQPQPFEKKLYEMEQIIRTESELKNNASSEQKYISYENQVNHYIQHLDNILNTNNIPQAVKDYELYSVNQDNSNSSPSEIDIPATHFFKEAINTNIQYSSTVFNYIKPVNHQYYISEAAKTYHVITPFKIKHISQSIVDPPLINRPNFFAPDIEAEKTILHYCVPNTHKIGFYALSDITGLQTVSKEFYQERQLNNEWNFSPDTRSVITPTGKIYAVNCRTTKDKIDSYLYEITEVKASNRGPLPSPKRDSSIIYLNGSIYVIGGAGQCQKCSKKAYRYGIKQKKWHQLRDSNVALRKPTLCTVSNRFICKLGGLNEFDYINKVIEMYDSLTDRWSLVRASPRNILEQVQILEDSHALQISDDQIYIFGGKNANKFATDTGFMLMISQIREKRKGAARVSGQFWNVSIGRHNILTFFGDFTTSSVLIHHNCLYGLRTEVTQPLL